MQLKNIYFIILLLLLCSLLTTCGGGGTSAIPNSVPTPTQTTNNPTPTPTPVITPPSIQITPTFTSTPKPLAPTPTFTSTPKPGSSLIGTVTDLFTGAPVSGVTVSLNGNTTTTASNGNYSIPKNSSATLRMNITGSIVTRSLPVDLSLSQQNITILPLTYNTVMFRALTTWGSSSTTTLRWPDTTKPHFVIYDTVWDTNTPLDPNYINAIEGVLKNEIFTNTIADGFFSTSTFEVFHGRPIDDPNRWITGTGQDSDWGYIGDGTDIAIAVRQNFTDPAVAGKGGPVWYPNHYLAGGGAVIRLDQFPNNIDVARHEIGHTLGLSHPFQNITPDSNPDLLPSVMNYSFTGKHTLDYSTADLQAFKCIYHRAPGNAAPDTDPDGFSGYFKYGPNDITVIVISDPPLK